MVPFIVDILIVTFDLAIVIGSFFVDATFDRSVVGLVEVVGLIEAPVAIRMDDEFSRETTS